MIYASPPIDQDAVSNMVKEVRESGAEVLGSPSNNIWVMFQPLLPAHFHSDDRQGVEPHRHYEKPIVIIKIQAGRTSAQRDAFAKTISFSVGRALSVPADQVWLQYQEMDPHDVWFNGRWSNNR